MKLAKQITAAAVAIVSAVALAGCGSTPATGRGSDLTAQQFAGHLRSAEITARSVHVTGQVTIAGRRVSFISDQALGAGTLTDLTAKATLRPATGGTVQIRLVRGVVYVNATGVGLGAGGAKPWMSMNLTNRANPLGAVVTQIVSQLDPATMANIFKAVTTLRERGAARVDGVPTTQYAVTVDTAKAVHLMGLDRVGGPMVQQALARLPKTLTYDVWLGPAERPVRITARLAGVAVDLHLSRWGEHVVVSPPPAGQVASFGG